MAVPAASARRVARAVRVLAAKQHAYREWLRRLVETNSYTLNAPGVMLVNSLTQTMLEPLGFDDVRVVPSRFRDERGYADHMLLRRSASQAATIGKPDDAHASDAEDRSDTTPPVSSRFGRLPVVALVSHADTVFPAEVEEANGFRWTDTGQGDDEIRGPGTMDIKGGTVLHAMTLEALRIIDPMCFYGTTWWACYNASEEVMAPDFGQVCIDAFRSGVSHKDARADDPGVDAAIVYEAGPRWRVVDATAAPAHDDTGGTGGGSAGLSDADLAAVQLLSGWRYKVVRARKGMAVWKLRATGREAHAGANHSSGVSAIDALAQVIVAIHKVTNYDKGVSVNCGSISGGTTHNTVSGQAEAMVEMRAPTRDVFDAAVEAVEAACAPSALAPGANGEVASVTVERLNVVPPWMGNDGTDGLVSHWEAACSDVKCELETELRGGLSDGNWLWQTCPTIDGIGPSGYHAHCSVGDPVTNRRAEFVEWGSMMPKAVVNALALRRFLRSGAATDPA